MHQGSQVATRDLEPPCQVAVHQRTNLVPRRVRHGLQCSWGGTRQRVSRWKGRVVAGLDGVAVVA